MRKELIILYRYPVNAVGYLLTWYSIFLLIFFGGQAVAGNEFGDRLGAIIVGYFLVTMSFTAFNELAYTFTREASWGTLEQLYMCDIGFRRATALISISQVVMGFLWGVVLLVLMMLTTGRFIAVDVFSVVPAVILAITPLIGVGLVVGGAALLYKRISNVFNLMQFGIVGLVAAPVEQYPLLKVLPLTQGSYVLQLVMTDGYRIWEVPTRELAILVAVAVGYFAVGYYLFERFVEATRNRGAMGHY